MRIPSFLRCAAFVAAVILITSAFGCNRRNGGGAANVLRYALQTKPTSLDPGTVEDGDTIDLLQQVFEGLVQWNEKNEIVPNLAEKWDISPDGKVYTFHIKKGVKFHNGKPLTARDFEYSLTRALKPELKSSTSRTYLNDIVGALALRDGNGKVDKLAGVKVIDDYTLQITLDNRRPYFLGKLTYPTGFVVNRDAVDANGGVVDEKAMIGTGPFKLRQYQAGYNVSLVANKEYHAGPPVLEGIERPIVMDNFTRETKYRSGDTDFTDLPRSSLDQAQADPQLKTQIKQFPRAQIYYLALNQLAFPQFKDKRVRQAFAYAIDKDSLIKLVLKDTVQKAGGMIPPGVPGYDSSFAGIPYDPKKAQQLLAAAGFPGGKGFPRLVISYRQGWQHIKDGVLAIREDLKRNLGLDVETQEVEWAQFLNQRTNAVMPCYHLRWAADYLDAQDFVSLMLRTGAEENKVGYNNPEFDAICDKADVESDPAKRAAMYHQAEMIAVDDAPWVPLYFFQDIELHKPYVKNIRDSLMGHLPHTTTTVAR
jgi:oligopeptide transport system substrate-binding protein